MEPKLMKCEKHPDSEVYLNRMGKYKYLRCKSCGVEYASETRRKIKREIVARMGGCCVFCGYSKSLSALEFHHPDTAKKDFSIGSGNTKGLERTYEEAKKCKLLCANCHREEHDNIRAGRMGVEPILRG